MGTVVKSVRRQMLEAHMKEVGARRHRRIVRALERDDRATYDRLTDTWDRDMEALVKQAAKSYGGRKDRPPEPLRTAQQCMTPLEIPLLRRQRREIRRIRSLVEAGR